MSYLYTAGSSAQRCRTERLGPEWVGGSVELVDDVRGHWKERKILSEPETSIKLQCRFTQQGARWLMASTGSGIRLASILYIKVSKRYLSHHHS